MRITRLVTLAFLWIIPAVAFAQTGSEIANFYGPTLSQKNHTYSTGYQTFTVPSPGPTGSSVINIVYWTYGFQGGGFPAGLSVKLCDQNNTCQDVSNMEHGGTTLFQGEFVLQTK